MHISLLNKISLLGTEYAIDYIIDNFAENHKYYTYTLYKTTIENAFISMKNQKYYRIKELFAKTEKYIYNYLNVYIHALKIMYEINMIYEEELQAKIINLLTVDIHTSNLLPASMKNLHDIFKILNKKMQDDYYSYTHEIFSSASKKLPNINLEILFSLY